MHVSSNLGFYTCLKMVFRKSDFDISMKKMKSYSCRLWNLNKTLLDLLFDLSLNLSFDLLFDLSLNLSFDFSLSSSLDPFFGRLSFCSSGSFPFTRTLAPPNGCECDTFAAGGNFSWGWPRVRSRDRHLKKPRHSYESELRLENKECQGVLKIKSKFIKLSVREVVNGWKLQHCPKSMSSRKLHRLKKR